ncbi:unnamed protein product [Haemonchus placei]|uniref:Mid2 domain-containing protein n=1 Tax=Haemonchus placei TaxID=6290 RepID=A0A0N4W6D7_HAEPC|nr:unnamed protein product [Haemonchus placei]
MRRLGRIGHCAQDGLKSEVGELALSSYPYPKVVITRYSFGLESCRSDMPPLLLVSKKNLIWCSVLATYVLLAEAIQCYTDDQTEQNYISKAGPEEKRVLKHFLKKRAAVSDANITSIPDPITSLSEVTASVAVSSEGASANVAASTTTITTIETSKNESVTLEASESETTITTMASESEAVTENSGSIGDSETVTTARQQLERGIADDSETTTKEVKKDATTPHGHSMLLIIILGIICVVLVLAIIALIPCAVGGGNKKEVKAPSVRMERKRRLDTEEKSFSLSRSQRRFVDYDDLFENNHADDIHWRQE